MPVVGRITAKFDADTKSLDASLKGMESGVDATAITVTRGFNSMEKSARKAQESIGQLAAGEQLKAGAEAFANIAGAVDGFRREMDRAGGQADDLRDRLSATFGDLADEKAKLAEKSLELGFNADSTANALITLKKFGVDSEDVLVRLQDAARFTNQSVDGLADSFGKFEKFGDAKSLKALQKELGISGEDMKKYGAAVDSANKVLLDTPPRVDAAKEALKRYEAVNFTGAADRQADAGTRLKGKIEELERQVGNTVVQFKDGFAPALIEVVDGLLGASDATKTFIGVGVEVVGTVANVASGALNMGAQMAILSQNATFAAGSARVLALANTALGSTWFAALGPIGLVALAIVALTNDMERNNAIAAEQMRMSQLGQKYYKEHAQVIGEAALAVREFGSATKEAVDKIVLNLARLGKTKVDITGAIAGNLQSINDKEAEIVKLQEENNNLTDEEYLKQLDTLEKQLVVLKEQDKALRAARAQAPAGPDTNPKTTGSVDDLSAKEQKRKAAEDKKNAAEAEKIRAAQIAAQIAAVKLEGAQGKLSIEQQIAGYQAISSAANLSAKERMALAITIAGLEKKLRDTATAEQKKDERERTAEANKAERERNSEAKKEAAQTAREKKKAEADALAASKKDDSQDKIDAGKIEQLAKEKIAAQTKAEDAAQAAAETDRGSAKDAAAIKKATAVIDATLKRKLEFTIAEINLEKAATIAATKNEQIKIDATLSAEAKIQAARAQSTNDLAKNVADQKRAMDDLVKADKDAKDKIANQVGGDRSPLSSDPGTGFSLSNFSFGGFSLAGASSQIKKQPAATITPFSPSPAAMQTGGALGSASTSSTVAADIGAQVADAIKSTPIAITVVANVDGQSAGQQTFSGTADQLASKANIFSSQHIMGKV